MEELTEMADLSLYLTTVNVSLGQTMESEKVSQLSSLFVGGTDKTKIYSSNGELLPQLIS